MLSPASSQDSAAWTEHQRADHANAGHKHAQSLASGPLNMIRLTARAFLDLRLQQFQNCSAFPSCDDAGHAAGAGTFRPSAHHLQSPSFCTRTWVSDNGGLSGVHNDSNCTRPRTEKACFVFGMQLPLSVPQVWKSCPESPLRTVRPRTSIRRSSNRSQ